MRGDALEELWEMWLASSFEERRSGPLRIRMAEIVEELTRVEREIMTARIHWWYEEHLGVL